MSRALKSSTRGRRRRWSDEEKLRIVEASFSAPWQVSATARRHGISNALLFAWRKAYREGRLVGVCGFVPAVVAAEKAVSTPPKMEHCAPLPEPDRDHAVRGQIVIVLGGAHRVIVDGDVDAAALRRVLDVLERRAVRHNSQGGGG